MGALDRSLRRWLLVRIGYALGLRLGQLGMPTRHRPDPSPNHYVLFRDSTSSIHTLHTQQGKSPYPPYHLLSYTDCRAYRLTQCYGSQDVDAKPGRLFRSSLGHPDVCACDLAIQKNPAADRLYTAQHGLPVRRLITRAYRLRNQSDTVLVLLQGPGGARAFFASDQVRECAGE